MRRWRHTHKVLEDLATANTSYVSICVTKIEDLEPAPLGMGAWLIHRNTPSPAKCGRSINGLNVITEMRYCTYSVFLSLLLAGAMRCCPLPNGSETRRNLERMRQTVADNKLHAYANYRRARTLLIILVSLLITYCVFSKV